MLESAVERKLRRLALDLGGDAFKINRKGYPDRIVWLPYGVTLFVELKRPGEMPRADQLRAHARLRKRGHVVLVEDGTTWTQTRHTMCALIRRRVKM